MTSARLEAFSDGVLAIIITIMVLEMKVPEGTDWEALHGVLPVFLSYVMSFVYLGIYWNNHHHMMHMTERVHGGILWANLHLLFWLSLVPFTTGWMGEHHAARVPTILYGINLLMAAIAYYILQSLIIRDQGPQSRLRTAIGNDWQGKASPLIYLAALPLALVHPGIAISLYILVALIWIVPDRRIERHIRE